MSPTPSGRFRPARSGGATMPLRRTTPVAPRGRRTDWGHRATRFRRRGHTELPRWCVFDDRAFLHHEEDVLRLMNVVERIAWDGDDVGELAGRNGSHSVIDA